MNVTLKLGELAVSERLSTYQITKNITYREVITTLDDVEHPYPGTAKTVLSFSLFPMTDQETASVYATLSPLILPVTYTDSFSGADVTKTMRIMTDLESTFLLTSVDGQRRYRGGTIQLREL